MSALVLDDARLVRIAASASQCDPLDVVDTADMAALAAVVAGCERAPTPTDRAAAALVGIVHLKPFARHNRAAAWLAAASVLAQARLRPVLHEDDVVRLLELVDQGQARVGDVARRLARACGEQAPSWSCPACGRTLHCYERDVARVRTVLVGTSSTELVARCWYEHRMHDRKGRSIAPRAGEQSTATWRPIVWSSDRDAFLVVHDSGALLLRAIGDESRWSVASVDEFHAADLVGDWAPFVDRTRPVGVVTTSELRFDAARGEVDVRAVLASIRGPLLETV